MKIFNDRMILDRKDFELAMKQEIASVNSGLITMYIAKQYKRILVDNIHEQALKLNKLYEEIIALDINSIYPDKILELSSCLGALNTALYITKRSREELIEGLPGYDTCYGHNFEVVDRDSIHVIKEKTKIS